MNRRKFVNSLGLGVVASAIPASILGSSKIDYQPYDSEVFKAYSFPDLPYAYDALEPSIDKMTMEIHYSKHHKGYFKKFMAAIKDTEHENTPIMKLFSKISSLPTGIRNSGGGFYNHSLFWNNMTPDKTKPSKDLSLAIDAAFGSMGMFKEKFSKAAATRFGSGWAWLVLKRDGQLAVSSTANQDNPLMDIADVKGMPLLTIDVWEHAYYLKYQNKRVDYINSFWNVVNWDEVSKRFKKASK